MLVILERFFSSEHAFMEAFHLFNSDLYYVYARVEKNCKTSLPYIRSFSRFIPVAEWRQNAQIYMDDVILTQIANLLGGRMNGPNRH